MTDMCKIFETSLMELAYGELSESEGDKLRMHASTCPSCRESLEGVLLTRKLAANLPLEDPGDTLDATLLGAAAAQAEKKAKSMGAPSREGRQKYVETTPAIWDWLRGLLLRPAFASAAVVVLICLFTFYIVNNSQSPSRETPNQYAIPTPILEPDDAPGDSSRPGIERERVDSTDAKDESRVGSAERSAEGAYEEGTPRDRFPAARERTPKDPQPSFSTGTRGRRSVGKGSSGDSYGSATSGAKTLGETAKKKSKPRATPGLDDLYGGGFASPPPSGPGPAGGLGTPSPNQVPEIQSPKKSAPAPSHDSEAELGDTMTQGSGGYDAPSNSTSDYDRGMEAFARGDCNFAVTCFERVLRGGASAATKASATHQIARCEKRRGRFAAASTWYDRLLSSYPSYPKRPEALFESANCLHRLGRTDVAKQRLSALLEFPAWRDRAQAELDRISH